MLSILVIVVASIIVVLRYGKDYFQGLLGAVFILVLMPDNIALEISQSLPSITVHRVVAAIMILFWAFRSDARRPVSMQVPFLTILTLMTVSYGVSSMFSPNFLISFKRFLYFVLESIVFFIVVATSIRDEADGRRLVKTIVIALTVVAILGIVEHFTGFNPSERFGARHTYDLQVNIFQLGRSGVGVSANDVTSTYGHRIHFGIAMATGILCCLFFLNRSGGLAGTIVFWILTLLFFLALYFSQSRGPMLGFFAGALFMGMFEFRKYIGKIAVVACITALVLVLKPGVMQTLESLWESTQSADTVRGSSFRWRSIVAKMAWYMITEEGHAGNVLFGFGQAAHHLMEFPEAELSTGHHAQIESWDCDYAVTLFEQGVFGLLLMIIFYFQVFWQGIFKLGPRQKELGRFLLGCIVLMVFMKTNVRFFVPGVNYLEFSFAAILSALVMKTKEENIAEEAR